MRYGDENADPTGVLGLKSLVRRGHGRLCREEWATGRGEGVQDEFVSDGAGAGAAGRLALRKGRPEVVPHSACARPRPAALSRGTRGSMGKMLRTKAPPPARGSLRSAVPGDGNVGVRSPLQLQLAPDPPAAKALTHP